MTERMPFSEDIFHDPANEGFIDVQQLPTWADFCSEAEDAKRALIICDPNEEGAVKTVMHHMEVLDEVLGDEYTGRRSKVLGLGYLMDEVTGELADESTSLNADDLTYAGAVIRPVADGWQVYMDFRNYRQSEELSPGFYAVPLNANHLMDFRLIPKANEPKTVESETRDVEKENSELLETLQRIVHATRAQVTHEDFQNCEPDIQRMILENMADDADNDIPSDLRERDVTISGRQYYTVYDGMTELDMRHCPTDHTMTTEEYYPALKGEIKGVEYPELATIPTDQKITADDLFINEGAPCVVVRDDDKGRTYYVLPQSIEAIL